MGLDEWESDDDVIQVDKCIDWDMENETENQLREAYLEEGLDINNFNIETDEE